MEHKGLFRPVTLRPRLSVGFALFEAERSARQRIPLGHQNIFNVADARMQFVTLKTRPWGRRDERHLLGDGRPSFPDEAT